MEIYSQDDRLLKKTEEVNEEKGKKLRKKLNGKRIKKNIETKQGRMHIQS